MVGPDRRVAAVRRAVTAAVADLSDDALVLVACSGGPDSLALAACAAFAVPRTGARRVGAVVVDHGLVAGSSDVAAWAADRCRALGLDPVLVVRVDVTGPGGPEAAARAARYAALERVADETGAAAVLLGHTLDDQAETVLLGLARGSGARSLAGMPAVRGRLRRPLLDVRRADTLAVCAALGLDPWHDPTNAGGPDDPLRSRVRAHVLPVLERELGPGVAAALARTATQLREDAVALEAAADELVARARTVAGVSRGPADERAAGSPDERAGERADGPSDERAGEPSDGPSDGPGAGSRRDRDLVVLDARTLAAAPDAVRRRAVRSALVAAGAPAGSVHRVHVLAVDALLVEWRGQGPVQVPGRVVARRCCGSLVVGPDDPPLDPAGGPGTTRTHRAE